MDKIIIREVTTLEKENVEAVNRLLKQLTSSPCIISADELQRMINSESSRLFFAYIGIEVVGMLTLCSYMSPTGFKSWVEDVVVDEDFRGLSIGRNLIEYAISEAEKIRGNVLMLTSKPARLAANALYRSVGFLPKETNVYRMKFEEK